MGAPSHCADPCGVFGVAWPGAPICCSCALAWVQLPMSILLLSGVVNFLLPTLLARTRSRLPRTDTVSTRLLLPVPSLLSSTCGSARRSGVGCIVVLLMALWILTLWSFYGVCEPRGAEMCQSDRLLSVPVLLLAPYPSDFTMALPCISHRVPILVMRE